MKNKDQIVIEHLKLTLRTKDAEAFEKEGQKYLLSMAGTMDGGMKKSEETFGRPVNFGELSDFIVKYTEAHVWENAWEAAARTAEEILIFAPQIFGVQLDLKAENVSLDASPYSGYMRVSRFRHRAYIALGSNLGDKKAYLDFAVQKLNQMRGCRVEKVSSYIVTKPYGGVEQDDFLNACLSLETLFSPEELLIQIHKVEQEAGRERKIHWGPRTLDLDILLYDDCTVETDKLLIPHAEMHKRDFVLRPLSEIAPYVRHPISKKTVSELLNACVLSIEDEQSL